MTTLTSKDREILANFTTINEGIVFDKGNVITTKSKADHILAQANFDCSFPQKFAIEDLSQFLRAMSIFSDLELEFCEKWIRLYDKKKDQESHFWYSREDWIEGYNKDKGWPKIKLPSEDIKFEMSPELLSDIQKAGSSLGQLPHICVEGKEGVLSLIVKDTNNITSNDWKQKIGQTGHTCNIIFTRDYWKFIPRTYNVSISKQCLAKFETEDVKYFVTAEATSTFEDK